MLAPTVMIRAIALYALGAMLFACSNAPREEVEEGGYPVPSLVPTGDVVAQVGPTTITTDEIEERIRLQTPMLRARLKDPEELRRFVESEVRSELLAQVGYEEGLFDDPEVQLTMRVAVVRKLMREKMSEIDNNIEVTDAEIYALYQENEDEYYRPERARIAMLSISAETPAEKAKAQARLKKIATKVRAELKAGRRTAFDEAARQITGEQNQPRTSVDLGFLTREQLEEEVGTAAAAQVFDKMTVGDVEVVELDDRVVLMNKTGRRGEVRRSLESVKPALHSQVRAKKRNEALENFVVKLAKDRNIELSVANVGKIAVEGQPPTPPKSQNEPEAPKE